MSNNIVKVEKQYEMFYAIKSLYGEVDAMASIVQNPSEQAPPKNTMLDWEEQIENFIEKIIHLREEVKEFYEFD